MIGDDDEIERARLAERHRLKRDLALAIATGAPFRDFDVVAARADATLAAGPARASLCRGATDSRATVRESAAFLVSLRRSARHRARDGGDQARCDGARDTATVPRNQALILRYEGESSKFARFSRGRALEFVVARDPAYITVPVPRTSFFLGVSRAARSASSAAAWALARSRSASTSSSA